MLIVTPDVYAWLAGYGVAAGCAYLASVAVGLLSNVVLRRSWLSWLPWAVAFALYPFFLSYGGWAGDSSGSAPQPVAVIAAAQASLGDDGRATPPFFPDQLDRPPLA